MDMAERIGRESIGAGRTCETLDVAVQRLAEPSSVAHRRYDQPFVVIGRDDDCHLSLPDPTVAPRSLYLQQLDNRVVVVDLGSFECGQRTGVLSLPGRRYIDVLPAGAVVPVGAYQVWHSAASPIDIEPEALSDVEPLPPFPEAIAVWEIANVRGERYAHHPRHIRHDLTLIGQGPLCRFRVQHPSIEEIHACLTYTQGRLQVVDLCSRHGVFVNGRRVSQAELSDGDELSVGQCRGTIHWLAPHLPWEISLGSFNDASGRREPSLTPPGEGIVVAEPLESLTVDGDLKGHGDSRRNGEIQGNGENGTGQNGRAQAGIPSDEFVLSLLEQFLEMQKALVEQSRSLMKKLSDRLDQIEEPSLGMIEESGTDEPEGAAVGSVAPSEDEGMLQEASGGGRPHDAVTSPKLHEWLTQRLSGMESGPESGISRLWSRLKNAK